MFQPSYVRSLILELVGVRAPEAAAEDAEGEEVARQREELARATARALRAVLLDVAALAILLGWRLYAGETALPFDRNEESVFTLGILAVAIHLGLRLAHRIRLQRAIEAWDDLPD